MRIHPPLRWYSSLALRTMRASSADNPLVLAPLFTLAELAEDGRVLG